MSEINQKYQRFSILQRVEHLILLLSFTILALTGLPQKFFQAGISQWLMQALGGIELVRIIHRIASTVFVLLAVYHFAGLGFKLIVQRKEANMLPNFKDAKDAIQAFLFNLGLSRKPPRMGHFNFTEKMEYWAMIWGLILMAISGYMLWNPIATAKILPGVVIPAAKALHGAEAILAVLAILIWHFYNVHIKGWNWSMIKGWLSYEQMHEDHAAELDKQAGEPQPVVRSTPVQIRQRSRIYVPVALLLTAIATAALVRFLTFEETAIDTIPVVEAAKVFAPLTPTPLPPTRTPFPKVTTIPMNPNQPRISGESWETGVAALFEAKCATCHGAAGGLDLSSYAGIIKGGNSGPALDTAVPENSHVLTKVAGGDHPGTFSNAEAEAILDWITRGAPEKP